MKRLTVATLILCFITLQTANALQISEIMYDFPGSDDNHEWIEMYNNDTEPLNTSDWKLYVNSNHTLNLVNGSIILDPYSYAVIAEDSGQFLTDNPLFNSTLFDSSFTLTNSAGYIEIFNATISDSLNYSSAWGGNGAGRTLCIINNTWQECEPTPGYANTPVVINNVTTNETVIDYDPWLIITIDKDIFNNESVKYDFVINHSYCNGTEHEISINYWIEDLYGHVMKSADNTTKNMTCYLKIDRSWTPNDIIGSEEYVIYANMSANNCNDTNITNNFYNKTITFNGSLINYTSINDTSHIKILESPSESRYGESINVRVEVYRNSTAKYAIYGYVTDGSSKLSDEPVFHADTKNTLYNTSILIQLKPNCDSTYAYGYHTIIITGLDITATKEININSASSCRTTQSSSAASVAPAPKPKYYDVTYYPKEVGIGEEFNITVKINLAQQNNISVYSYVHNGTEMISQGYNNKWMSTWTANKQSLVVKNASITLRNKIKDGAEAGIYNLRVRFVDDKEHDIDNPITVTRKINSSGNNTTIDGDNKTNNNLATTGMVTANNHKFAASNHLKVVMMLMIKNVKVNPLASFIFGG